MYDVIIIGAGQAGLATGYHLQRLGVRFMILEAQAQAAGGWPQYYDSLTLFSPARYSALPGMPFPGDPEHYPTRDEVIEYLTGYAAAFKLPIRTNTRVQRVEKTGSGFRVITDGGDFEARSVISATGSFNRPNVPVMDGMTEYKGRILHSGEYRNPPPFVDQRVVVVGAGNSAIQIAVELAEVARVTLATRKRIRFLPQCLLGKDFHFWIKHLGVERIPAKGKARSVDVLDTGKYRRAIAAGKPDRKPMFTHFTESGVAWLDSEEAVDAVIFATGYRPNLDMLAGLGALDAEGQPIHERGISTMVAGLYYMGLSNQRFLTSATLRGVGADAQVVVKHLAGYLLTTPPTAAPKLASEGASHD